MFRQAKIIGSLAGFSILSRHTLRADDTNLLSKTKIGIEQPSVYLPSMSLTDRLQNFAKRPCDGVYALASRDAYLEVAARKALLEDDGQMDPTIFKDWPDGWRIISTYPEGPSVRPGIFALAYEHKDDRQCIVAYRGTSPPSAEPGQGSFEQLAGDLTVDAKLAQGAWDSYYLDAAKFALKMWQRSESEGQQLSFAGHSLGGFLAIISMHSLYYRANTPSDIPLFAVTLDNPGVKKLLKHWEKPRKHVASGRDWTLHDLDVTNYFSGATNIVNCCGHHLGTLYQIVDHEFKMNVNPKVYLLSSHDRKRLASAFNLAVPYVGGRSTASPRFEIYRMQAWPAIEIPEKSPGLSGILSLAVGELAASQDNSTAPDMPAEQSASASWLKKIIARLPSIPGNSWGKILKATVKLGNSVYSLATQGVDAAQYTHAKAAVIDGSSSKPSKDVEESLHLAMLAGLQFHTYQGDNALALRHFPKALRTFLTNFYELKLLTPTDTEALKAYLIDKGIDEFLWDYKLEGDKKHRLLILPVDQSAEKFRHKLCDWGAKHEAMLGKNYGNLVRTFSAAFIQEQRQYGGNVMQSSNFSSMTNFGRCKHYTPTRNEDSLINTLAKARDAGKTVIRHALVGISGSGKTVLARRYIEAQKKLYPKALVAIFNAEYPHNLQSDYRRMAREDLDISNAETLSDDALIASVGEVLDERNCETEFECIWLFDNANTCADIERLFPPEGVKSVVLCTSQNQTFFTGNESSVQNQKMLGMSDSEVCDLAAQFLGSLDNRPLARDKIIKLGRYFQGVAQNLQEVFAAIQIDGVDTLLSYEQTIADWIAEYEPHGNLSAAMAAHELALSRYLGLPEASTRESRLADIINFKTTWRGALGFYLLSLCSYLNPEQITLGLLVDAVNAFPPVTLPKGLSTEDAIKQIMFDLSKRSLVQIASGNENHSLSDSKVSYRLHRSTAMRHRDVLEHARWSQSRSIHGNNFVYTTDNPAEAYILQGLQLLPSLNSLTEADLVAHLARLPHVESLFEAARQLGISNADKNRWHKPLFQAELRAATLLGHKLMQADDYRGAKYYLGLTRALLGAEVKPLIDKPTEETAGQVIEKLRHVVPDEELAMVVDLIANALRYQGRLVEWTEENRQVFYDSRHELAAAIKLREALQLSNHNTPLQRWLCQDDLGYVYLKNANLSGLSHEKRDKYIQKAQVLFEQILCETNTPLYQKSAAFRRYKAHVRLAEIALGSNDFTTAFEHLKKARGAYVVARDTQNKNNKKHGKASSNLRNRDLDWAWMDYYLADNAQVRDIKKAQIIWDNANKEISTQRLSADKARLDQYAAKLALANNELRAMDEAITACEEKQKIIYAAYPRHPRRQELQQLKEIHMAMESSNDGSPSKAPN